ncbi:MAG: hypothetical protein HOV80_31750 [Polyangiaceae bacterium]|nr:hypothetical protein [Polyangiaceae bacterium]
MSDGEQSGGGGHGKVGIGAAILAALAGVGKFADDCGRAGATAAHFGDDAARGASRFGGVADDVGRAGLHAGDDALRAGRGAAVLEGAAHVPLGEGRLVNVVDDVAPGAGRSVEEALVEVGKEVTFEVVTFDFPEAEGGDDTTAPPTRVLSPRVLSGTFSTEMPKAGELVVVTGQAGDDGTMAFGGERLTDAEVHGRCAKAGARCVVVSCKSPSCGSLASGIGRMAVTRVSPTASFDKRYAQLSYAVLERAADFQDMQVSRVEAKADKIVRSFSKGIEKR